AEVDDINGIRFATPNDCDGAVRQFSRVLEAADAARERENKALDLADAGNCATLKEKYNIETLLASPPVGHLRAPATLDDWSDVEIRWLTESWQFSINGQSVTVNG